MKSLQIVIFIILTLFLISCTKNDDKISALDIVAKTNRMINDLNSLFIQTQFTGNFGDLPVQKKIYYEKNRWRIEYSDSTFEVYNGKDYWKVGPRTETVERNYNPGNPISHLMIPTIYDFTYGGSETINEREAYVIVGILNEGTKNTTVTWWIDKKTYFPLQSQLMSVNRAQTENAATIKIFNYNFELNPSLADNLFTFDEE